MGSTSCWRSPLLWSAHPPPIVKATSYAVVATAKQSEPHLSLCSQHPALQPHLAPTPFILHLHDDTADILPSTLSDQTTFHQGFERDCALLHLMWDALALLQSIEETDGILKACKDAGVMFMDGTM